MAARERFRLVFAPEVLEHLGVIERKHHGMIEETLDEQLCITPELETRNRKPLRQPALFGATWELRFGPGNRFRLFYEVDLEQRAVCILALGVKEGNRLLVGREEFEL